MKEIRHIVTEIAPHSWCINEFNLVNAFLVEGEERSALIDAGCGIGNIAEAVRACTSKPLEVILTHGHADHFGGLYNLAGAPVYMNPLDKPIESFFACDNKFRRLYIETRGPVRFPGEGNQEAMLALVPSPDPMLVSVRDTLPIREGDVFDLGGRTLEAFHTPGHSDGSMCFLDSKTRILFSGDTVNHNIILMRQENNDPRLIRIYHDTVKKLWDLSDRYDVLAIGHDGITVDKQIVHDYLELTEGLLSGEIVGKYEEVGIRKGDVARLGMAELWYQCDA